MPEESDLVTAIFELFLSILRRTLLASDAGPLGAIWKERCIGVRPYLRFNARVDCRANELPFYKYNFGAALAILDVCNELSADPHFFPAVTFDAKPQSTRSEGAYAVRFVDYNVNSEDISVPIPDFSNDGRLTLFDHIFSMSCRFLALHEQGHYFLGHLSYNERYNMTHEAAWLEAEEENVPGLSPSVARALELQADRFALDLLFLSGLRLRDEEAPPDRAFEDVHTFEEWLVKAAVGGLLVCGIFELSERETKKAVDERAHPSAAARTIALITSLRQVMVDHLASTTEADRVLIEVVQNAQCLYRVLGVSPLAENAMHAWMNRDRCEDSAIDEYREAARLLRTMRPELKSYEALAHRPFGVTAPNIDADLLVE